MRMRRHGIMYEIIIDVGGWGTRRQRNLTGGWFEECDYEDMWVENNILSRG